MHAAARSALERVSSRDIPLARATPMRRPGRLLGLPKSNSWVSASERACSTPLYAIEERVSFARITLLAAASALVRVGIGSLSTARRCSSNSLRFWLIRVTRPVSCGLGDSSEKIT